MWARLVASMYLLVTAGAVPAEPPLSPGERQRLTQGEVVYRAGAAPRDGMSVPGARGAIAFVRVPTPPDPVWAILTRPTRYPEIFPALRSVDILEESPVAWLLRTEGQFGPFTFRYHTRYRIQAETRTIAWRLDASRDNDIFEDTWGWWRLLPDDGATLVVYAIGSIPSSWQPLSGFFERRGIIQALTALREAALRRERSAQSRAVAP